jgi:hypothetical protein
MHKLSAAWLLVPASLVCLDIYIDIHISIDLLFFYLLEKIVLNIRVIFLIIIFFLPVCGADLPLCQKCFAAYGGTMWQVCKLPQTHLEALSIFLSLVLGCPCVKNIIPTINC